ncbi:MAG: hypothetical protein R3321_05370 [Nitrososphaeraceae archaeon]|nr:hypothetical protein [Nitrososphaeraceae archaeon]
MNIDHWCKIDEGLVIAETDEIYKKYAGLEYSNKVISNIAELRFKNANLFLDLFHEPLDLYVSVATNFVESITRELELKLYDLRSKKIKSKKHRFTGLNEICWNNWRQYNSYERDHKKRKEVYDEFIRNTKYISPIIIKRFKEIKNTYSKINSKNHKGIDLNPLNCYLHNEHISYNSLIEFVTNMGNKASKPFKKSLKNISMEILGKNCEYYDDFYFFRNKVYNDFEKVFYNINPIKEVKRVLKTLSFQLERISFDSEDRKNKYPSPICFFVQIPKDIRILYKSESPYFDLQGCFHEFGHAMHASSINPNLEYWKKYFIAMGISEIFSILLERLTKNENFLKSSLGIKDPKILESIINRNNFMELFFVTFYSANSLMKIAFWEKDLNVSESNKIYSDLMYRFTGIRIPGKYWMLHHILPDSIMYVPSYLLAAVRAKELEVFLQNKFGEKWWLEKEAGRFLKNLMYVGSDLHLSSFSNLDKNLFLKEIVR